MITKTTKTVKPADADIKWYLIDADGVILGRLESQIATILRGKNKPCFPGINLDYYILFILYLWNMIC